MSPEMSSKIEKPENNKVKLTMEVTAERFEEGLQNAYLTNRGRINLQGFRKGKAPRKIIEMQMGKEIFFEDAINYVMPDAYEAAVKEHNLFVVSKPEIDVIEVSTESGVTFTAEFFVKPEVTVFNYERIKYKKPEIAVTDDEINAELDKEREKSSRIITVTDRAVQDGDTAIIDFEGFVDGVAFAGGKGEDYELVIGSHSFIDTFEEQLIGSSIGDKTDVNVTFPKEYGNEELASKSALFKVEIKGIKCKELPAADDDFAKDVSEFDTLAEYKADIKAKIQADKEKQAESDIESQVLEGLIALAVMDVPEVMFESETEQMVKDFGRRIQSQGLTMEQYFMYTGTDIEALRKSYRENAEKNVKGRLALEAVVDKEGFEVSDEEYNDELDRIAKMYGMEAEKLKAAMGEDESEGLKKDLKVQKALKKIVDAAIEE